jgi:hypothetical protein
LLLVELDTEDKKRFKDRKTAQVADVAKPQTAKPVVAKPVKSEVKTSDVKPQVAQKTPTKK